MMRMPDNGRRRQQRYCLVALLLALPLLSPLSAQAGIFKCVAANGEITFSQTPCPKVNTEAPAEEDTRDVAADSVVPISERTNDANADQNAPVPTDIVLASNTAQAAPLPPIDMPGEPENSPDNEALLAQKRNYDAREEEYRLQCEGNIKSQINSINLQMRKSSHSSSLVDSLQKKRRTLESRLDDC